MRAHRIVVATAVTALALSACAKNTTGGFALPTSLPPSGSPTPSASASAAASPSTSASASAVPATCALDQLAVTLGPVSGAAGSVGGLFILTNTSAQSCSLYGYPGMLLLNALGDPMTTHVIRGTSVVVPAVPKTTVILPPGAQGSFLFGFSDVPTGSQTCPTSASVEVTPPNLTDHATIAFAMAPCGGRITVSPVRLGTAPV